MAGRFRQPGRLSTFDRNLNQMALQLLSGGLLRLEVWVWNISRFGDSHG